jgi:5-methyltetrahydrofolate--homocysteine methyltransferase
MKTNILSDLTIKINPDSVLKRLDKGVNRAKWNQLVERTVERYGSRIRPRGVYHEITCRPNGSIVDIGGGFSFRSEFLKTRLGKDREGAVFLVTIGSQLEDIIKGESLDGKNITAYILDCLGSSAAESSAAAIQKIVAADFGIKMCRYSPGYNDWHIEQQKILFEFLGAKVTKTLGVDLTHDYMMCPRKSVSGIIIPKNGE